MRIRAFVERHPWTRVLFVVALVLFVVVCVLHVTGGHYSTDGDGSALTDSAAGLALVLVVVVGFLAPAARRQRLPSWASSAPTRARAVPCPVAPGRAVREARLRC